MRPTLELLARLGWRRLGMVLAALVVAFVWWWAPPLLAKLSYFRVSGVRVEGARYVEPADIWSRLALDSTASVWDDVTPLEQRIATHPQVRSVEIGRKLPDTLVVHIMENRPVALVPSPTGMRAVDADGNILPIDPSRVSMDLPVLARVDTAATRVLGDIRRAAPALFGRINDVRPVGRDELAFQMGNFLVRAGRDVTASRFADIIPVEADLARRGARASELDLRFREQVIARVQ